MNWNRERHAAARAFSRNEYNRPDGYWTQCVIGEALDEIERLNRELVRIALTLESTAHLPAEEMLHDLPLAMGILEKMRGAHALA